MTQKIYAFVIVASHYEILKKKLYSKEINMK